MTWFTSLNCLFMLKNITISITRTLFSQPQPQALSWIKYQYCSPFYIHYFLHRLITILCMSVYLHVTIRIGWVVKFFFFKALKKFGHTFQISLNYACKDFQFGTWLENRLQWASIFPLASNPEISSTTLKTFCFQSIWCYSHSHKRQDNNCRLSAFHWAETYWCKNRSAFMPLMWLSLSHQHAPRSKLISKVGTAWIEYSNFV